EGRALEQGDRAPPRRARGEREVPRREAPEEDGDEGPPRPRALRQGDRPGDRAAAGVRARGGALNEIRGGHAGPRNRPMRRSEGPSRSRYLFGGPHPTWVVPVRISTRPGSRVPSHEVECSARPGRASPS